VRIESGSGQQECYFVASTEWRGALVKGDTTNSLRRALQSLHDELSTMRCTVDGVCWWRAAGAVSKEDDDE
jgi:hypothetical protein